MSRYIDADALVKKIDLLFRETTTEDSVIPHYNHGVADALAIINNQLTADVRENVHGKNISENGFLCSVCGFGDFGGFHGYEPNYCPNCGAKMEVEHE